MLMRVAANHMTRDWLRWNRLPIRSPKMRAMMSPGQERYATTSVTPLFITKSTFFRMKSYQLCTQIFRREISPLILLSRKEWPLPSR